MQPEIDSKAEKFSECNDFWWGFKVFRCDESEIDSFWTAAVKS
jgi:hypothetical protein